MAAADLTEFQVRALTLIRNKGPLLSAEVGEEVWPERRFKSRQGAALAGGGIMGKLAKLGLVHTKYRAPDSRGKTWPAGWVLTFKGRLALAESERA